jgi:hypothetical protein
MPEERAGLVRPSAHLSLAKLEGNGRAKPGHGCGSHQSQLGALRSIPPIGGEFWSFANWREHLPEECSQVTSVKGATLEGRVGLARLSVYLLPAKLEKSVPGSH